MSTHTEAYDRLLDIGYTELEAFEEVASTLLFNGTLHDVQDLFLHHRIVCTKNTQKEIKELEHSFKQLKQMEADRNERITKAI